MITNVNDDGDFRRPKSSDVIFKEADNTMMVTARYRMYPSKKNKKPIRRKCSIMRMPMTGGIDSIEHRDDDDDENNNQKEPPSFYLDDKDWNRIGATLMKHPYLNNNNSNSNSNSKSRPTSSSDSRPGLENKSKVVSTRQQQQPPALIIIARSNNTVDSLTIPGIEFLEFDPLCCIYCTRLYN